VLFSRGTLHPGEPAVSVLGSRRACDQCLDWASEVSAALVSAGFTVVSGLAAGIDTAAHTAALEAGGRTVAVLGTGINRVYPAANRDLQERIACVGLVLSQFWPDAPATKKSFPLRNAMMSGYGRATIVVEVGEASGARALRHRPGVYVVSGVDEALGVVAVLRPDLDDVLTGVLAVDG
jgi:DNA processing protein